MKTTLAIAMAFMFVSSVYANPSATQGQQQQQNSSSNSDASASNAGNSQSIIFTSPGSTSAVVEQKINGTQTVKNVPSVSGPPLVTSNDTCHGSMSGSLNFAGFGGGVGSTIVDKNCVMLKNARELWNMGMRGAALARMCMDADNREALETTGFTCPQTEKAKKEEKNVATQQYTDPVIRARLGLDALSDKK